MQSKVGQSLLLQVGRQPQDMSSIVVVQSDGTAFFESDAILRISQGLDGPFFVGLGYMGLLVPRVLRDALYHVVSENRYRFGNENPVDWTLMENSRIDSSRHRRNYNVRPNFKV
jgi:predicted DCC family thiol-disulfide oxidoreductase YuxK